MPEFPNTFLWAIYFLKKSFQQIPTFQNTDNNQNNTKYTVTLKTFIPIDGANFLPQEGSPFLTKHCDTSNSKTKQNHQMHYLLHTQVVICSSSFLVLTIKPKKLGFYPSKSSAAWTFFLSPCLLLQTNLSYLSDFYKQPKGERGTLRCKFSNLKTDPIRQNALCLTGKSVISVELIIIISFYLYILTSNTSIESSEIIF